jgi:hypothetical protein
MPAIKGSHQLRQDFLCNLDALLDILLPNCPIHPQWRYELVVQAFPGLTTDISETPLPKKQRRSIRRPTSLIGRGNKVKCQKNALRSLTEKTTELPFLDNGYVNSHRPTGVGL